MTWRRPPAGAPRWRTSTRWMGVNAPSSQELEIGPRFARAGGGTCTPLPLARFALRRWCGRSRGPLADLRLVVSGAWTKAKSGPGSGLSHGVRLCPKTYSSKSACLASPEQGFGVHLLHEDPDHSLTIFAVSWLPHRGALPHDHGTWDVIAGVDEPEKNEFFERRDDRSCPGYAELKKVGERCSALVRCSLYAPANPEHLER